MTIGQEVFIYGRLRAVVRAIKSDGHISCDVYEGLPDEANRKKGVPMRLSYHPYFVNEKRENGIGFIRVR